MMHKIIYQKVWILRAKVFTPLTFLLPVFEYCAYVWRYAADKLLRYTSFNVVKVLLLELNMNLRHQRYARSLSLFIRVITKVYHTFHSRIELPVLPFLDAILDR